MTLAALALSLALNVAAAPAAAPAKKAESCRAQTVKKKTELTFPDGKTIAVDVVDTPATRETGLMCRRRLGKDYGMLFVFSQEMGLRFWMKKTLVSLDIVWIGADKRVTVVHEKLKASKVDTPDDQVAAAGGEGMFVLELPAGAAARHKLKAGDLLEFSVAIPPI